MHSIWRTCWNGLGCQVVRPSWGNLRPPKKVISGFCNLKCTEWIIFFRGVAEFTGSYRGVGVEVLRAYRIRGESEVSSVPCRQTIKTTGRDGVERLTAVCSERQVKYFRPERYKELMHVGWSGELSVGLSLRCWEWLAVQCGSHDVQCISHDVFSGRLACG